MKKDSLKEQSALHEALAASFATTLTPKPSSGGESRLPTDAATEFGEAVGVTESQSSLLRKTPVSFQAVEQEQIDKILDLLLKCRRHRGGFSDAVKIALRLCPLDPAVIGKAWDEARTQDRRTARPRKP